MSALATVPTVDLDHFVLPRELAATEPPELTLGRRDAVRMLVSIGEELPRPSTARDLSTWLQPGDLVVINTSATIPAAIDATTPGGEDVVVHLSTELPTGLHLVEVRRQQLDGSTAPDFGEHGSESLQLAGGGTVRVLGRMPGSIRLWVATLDLPSPLLEHLCRFGRPIRYGYVPESWPITAYQNSFAREPGSAEMPSAGRALTAEVVTDLVAHGIVVAPIVLHTGVASLEAHETPYPERYRGARSNGSTGQRHPRGRRTRRRHRHDRGAGARDRRRRRRRRPPRPRLDRARDHARSAACAPSTGCSPGGTSQRPATC